MLEYMSLGSLADVTKRIGGKIPEVALGKIAVQLLKGLQYLHNIHRVHRDIKPANIVLDLEGNVKLTDFGLTAELKSSLANCQTMCGTYSYMSPERISNNEYDYKCDIWALGITLHECAAGCYPYPQSTIYLELIQRIVQDPVPRLKGASSFSPKFLDFLECCLKKDPAERASVEQLIAHPWVKEIEDTEFDLAAWLKRKCASKE